MALNQKVIHHLSEMEMSNREWGGGTWPSMCQHEVLPKHTFLKRKAFQNRRGTQKESLYYRVTRVTNHLIWLPWMQPSRRF